MGLRDFVRFEPNQRVGLPDFDAVQRNARTDTRSSMLHLVRGSDPSAAAVHRVISGFQVNEDSGGPSAIVEVDNGAAIGSESLPDGSTDVGVAFGLQTPALQTVDFTGRAVSIYTLWIRFKQDPGVVGARVFWDDNLEQEDVESIDTRLVVTWDVVAETASPGAEWQRIADVVWDGVSVDNADITMRRFMFFEGDEGAAFAQEWGDGANDRNADRGQYGIRDLHTFSQMVRRQLTDMLGGGQDFFEVPANSINDHANATTNPHSALLTQTDLTVTGDFSVSGSSGLMFFASSDGSPAWIVDLNTPGVTGVMLGDMDVASPSVWNWVAGATLDMDGTLDFQGGTLDGGVTGDLSLAPSRFAFPSVITVTHVFPGVGAVIDATGGTGNWNSLYIPGGGAGGGMRMDTADSTLRDLCFPMMLNTAGELDAVRVYYTRSSGTNGDVRVEVMSVSTLGIVVSIATANDLSGAAGAQSLTLSSLGVTVSTILGYYIYVRVHNGGIANNITIHQAQADVKVSDLGEAI